MKAQHKSYRSIAKKLLISIFLISSVICSLLCLGISPAFAQTPLPRIDPSIIDPPRIDLPPDILERLRLRLPNWDFELGLTNWEKTGTAFDSQPTYGSNVIAARVIGNGTPYSMPLGGDYWRDTIFPIGHKGSNWIGTYENRPSAGILRGQIQGDSPVGTLTSQPFTISNDYITFLIGGGNDIDRLKIELLEETSPDRYQPVAGTARTGRNNELFRRDWWNVNTLRGKKARIRIVDYSTGGWGHINVDDIRFQDIEPPFAPPLEGSRSPVLAAYRDGNVWRDLDFPIWGFADMHTHLMSHLGFGGMILYGAPDTGSLMLSGQKYRGTDLFKRECNTQNEQAGTIEDALGNDNAMHGGPGIDNDCGDVIRTALIDKLEEKYIFESPNPGLAGQVNRHPQAGYPNFSHWPHWSSVSHQQMYWEWIKRAYDGGLRVMVTLPVNNSLLAKATNASQFIDDKSSVELQIREIQSFVGRHSNFMEIARTPADLRRIVRSNRMAVILGVETDDFGNLTRRANFDGERITPSVVDAEIRRLYNLGVRYILPIHFSNTVLGGYAINRDLFALSSKEYTNNFPSPRDSCGEGIRFRLSRTTFSGIEANLLRTRDLGRIIDTQPNYSPPSSGCGHANSLGLTPELGEPAIQTMMNLGMMIDVDHMSRLAVDKTLEIAETRNYPINSGHNGLLANDCFLGGSSNLQGCSENHRTTEQYNRIRDLGGMVGLGHGGKATNFVRNYKTLLEIMVGGVAIGTDVNGLEAMPEPDPQAPVRYDARFPMYRFGRPWDFNTVGFAHYGLFPDYVSSWLSSSNPATRMTPRDMDAFMSSAEDFARMWDKSLQASARVR